MVAAHALGSQQHKIQNYRITLIIFGSLLSLPDFCFSSSIHHPFFDVPALLPYTRQAQLQFSTGLFFPLPNLLGISLQPTCSLIILTPTLIIDHLETRPKIKYLDLCKSSNYLYTPLSMVGFLYVPVFSALDLFMLVVRTLLILKHYVFRHISVYQSYHF